MDTELKEVDAKDEVNQQENHVAKPEGEEGADQRRQCWVCGEFEGKHEAIVDITFHDIELLL